MIGEFLSQNICFLVVYILPAYDTFKFLKSFSPSVLLHSSQNHVEQQQQILQQSVFWLRYWCIVGIFTVAEYYVSYLLSWIIPLFYEIRVLFCLWLRYSKGAEILYTKQVEPRLSRNEQSIDQRMQDLRRQAFRKFLNLGSTFFVSLQRAIAQGVVEGQFMLLQAAKNRYQQPMPQNEHRQFHHSIASDTSSYSSPVRVTRETDSTTGETTTTVDVSQLKIPVSGRRRQSLGLSPMAPRAQSPMKIVETPAVVEVPAVPQEEATQQPIPFTLEEPLSVKSVESIESGPVESGLYPVLENLESFLPIIQSPVAEPVVVSVKKTPLTSKTARPAHAVSDKENLGSRSNIPLRSAANKFSSTVPHKKLTQRTTTKVQKKV